MASPVDFCRSIFIGMFVIVVFLLIRDDLVELSDRKEKTGNRLRFSQTLFSTFSMP
jgi:hypothetical protein